MALLWCLECESFITIEFCRRLTIRMPCHDSKCRKYLRFIYKNSRPKPINGRGKNGGYT